MVVLPSIHGRWNWLPVFNSELILKWIYQNKKRKESIHWKKCINQSLYRWWRTHAPIATCKQEETKGPHPAPRTHNCPMESWSHLFPKYPRGRSIFLLAWDQPKLLGIKSDCFLQGVFSSLQPLLLGKTSIQTKPSGLGQVLFGWVEPCFATKVLRYFKG